MDCLDTRTLSQITRVAEVRDQNFFLECPLAENSDLFGTSPTVGFGLGKSRAKDYRGVLTAPKLIPLSGAAEAGAQAGCYRTSMSSPMLFIGMFYGGRVDTGSSAVLESNG